MKSILLFILLFCICQGISAQSLPKQVVLEDLKGDKVCLDSLLNGKEPVVFAFWATWCKPCQSELEALLDIREE
ncbi:MAG: redoxin domain-containing protein, partial [Odoribacter sp.]